jgi:quercetin dioxygenase-like cupin family protein
MNPFTYFDDLAGLVADALPDSIVSRTIYKDDALNVVLFSFDAGQALSEHTAAQTAVIHILQGEATLTFDGETKTARAGAWLRLAPRQPHSVHAQTRLVMLLLLLQGETNPPPEAAR